MLSPTSKIHNYYGSSASVREPATSKLSVSSQPSSNTKTTKQEMLVKFRRGGKSASEIAENASPAQKQRAAKPPLVGKLTSASSAKKNEAVVGIVLEDIADEGDMLQSHGQSPPRQERGNLGAARPTLKVFSASRKSEAFANRPLLSTIISPARRKTVNHKVFAAKSQTKRTASIV